MCHDLISERRAGEYTQCPQTELSSDGVEMAKLPPLGFSMYKSMRGDSYLYLRFERYDMRSKLKIL
jgi:hypothetical protein